MALATPKLLSPMAASVKRKDSAFSSFKIPSPKRPKLHDRANVSALTKEFFATKSPVFEKAALRKAISATIQSSPKPAVVSKDEERSKEEVQGGEESFAVKTGQESSKALNSPGGPPAYEGALAALLKDPIRFVPATSLTANDERGVAGGMKLVRNEPPAQLQISEASTTIPKSWPSQTPGGPQGLRNPGALCYRLGVLQALLHLPMFYHWLQLHDCHSENSDCIACALKHLARAYWGQPARVKACLDRLNTVIKTIGRRSVPRWIHLSPFEQADAHEFMSWLLEILQNRFNAPPKTLERMFKIQHQASWRCQDCNHIHPGPAIDDLGLQLQIVTPRPNLAITAYIDQYYNDLVQDAKCEKCKSKKNRTRAISINSAPEILIVQLRRFELTRYGGRRKLISKVSFDDCLDLTKYAANPNASLGKGTKGIRYRLSSVIHHAGTLSSGHYISVAESRGGLFMLNDESVSRAVKGDMLDPRGGFTPYILTYLRV